MEWFALAQDGDRWGGSCECGEFLDYLSTC